MTHLKHPGIVATWKLKMDRNHYVRVFIWKDKESMYAANDYRCSFGCNDEMYTGHDYAGYASSCIQRVNVETGKRDAPPKFGEIYLVENLYHAEAAAHEIAHIVNYWGGFKDWIVNGRDDERSARLTGRLNGQFWHQHYKVFK